jgi:hypothetical protein
MWNGCGKGNDELGMMNDEKRTVNRDSPFCFNQIFP